MSSLLFFQYFQPPLSQKTSFYNWELLRTPCQLCANNGEHCSQGGAVVHLSYNLWIIWNLCLFVQHFQAIRGVLSLDFPHRLKIHTYLFNANMWITDSANDFKMKLNVSNVCICVDVVVLLYNCNYNFNRFKWPNK